MVRDAGDGGGGQAGEQQLVHRLLQRLVHGGRGLVEEQEIRLVEQRAGHGQGAAMPRR